MAVRPLSCALESRLDAFCNRSLHRIMGYSWEDFVSNQRLHRETGVGPVTRTIRDRQLRLYGHLARLPEVDPAHQVVSTRDDPRWRRPVGRPCKSWLGQIDQTCHDEVEMGRPPPGGLPRGTLVTGNKSRTGQCALPGVGPFD